MKKYDNDSSKEAWELFRIKYKTSDWDFWNEFDFDNVKTRFEKDGKYNNNRYLLWLKEDSKYLEKLGILFSFGGEKVFNFGTQYYNLECIVNEDNNELSKKQQCMELLNECKRFHSLEFNLSILPATGGLNNIKGSVYIDEYNEIKYSNKRLSGKQLDRFDTFITIMNDYFNKKSEIALSFCKGKPNQAYLVEFLDLFNEDIYAFFKKIYMLEDKPFVDCLIENGRRPINTMDDVERYCRLAKIYWEEVRKATLKWNC